MIIKMLLLFILILINGVFSATEIAFLSINKYKLNLEIKKNNAKAIKIAELLKDSSTFLSAIQIAITLSGFLASAFAAESFASELSEVIHISFLSQGTLTTILVILITIILSYFTLVLGELVPKKIGLAKADTLAFKMVGTITVVIKLCKPFIWVLRVSTDFVTKLLRINKRTENMEDDIKNSISDSNLEELEKDLLLNVFEFNDTTIEKAMTPKNKVISLNIDDSSESVIKTIRKYKFTRFPVLKNNEVIGILNVKDLIIKHTDDFSLKKYLRPVAKMKHNMIIDDAFLYLNSHLEAIAIVEKEKEYIGIITVEDIVEEIIGNIFDEYDQEEKENGL